MIAAYADPPYIGQARKHYRHDPRCAEVDHRELIATMTRDYEAWALSCSSPSLQEILSYCPDAVRVGAWVKPFCSFRPGINPAYAWEPVVFWGGRKRGRELLTVRDWVSVCSPLQRGLAGAKPDAFSFWLFEMLGLRPEDTLADLYPGTGAVTRAWEAWRGQLRFRTEVMP
jgi:hypothetical protein